LRRQKQRITAANPRQNSNEQPRISGIFYNNYWCTVGLNSTGGCRVRQTSERPAQLKWASTGDSFQGCPIRPHCIGIVKLKMQISDLYCRFPIDGQLPRSWPPSTEIVWPVTQLASGERRNSATRATSSGWPRRPNGIERRIALYSWGLLALCRSQLPPGNSIDP